MGIEEQLEAQLAEMEAAGPSLEDLLEGSVEEALEELLKVNTAADIKDYKKTSAHPSDFGIFPAAIYGSQEYLLFLRLP